jgi:hypothetical protein
MSVRKRIRRLEKVACVVGAGLVDNFLRCLERHGSEPAVDAAVDRFWGRIREAEAGLGRQVTLREWLDDGWMERHGLVEAINGLFRAVRDAEAGAAGTRANVP